MHTGTYFCVGDMCICWVSCVVQGEFCSGSKFSHQVEIRQRRRPVHRDSCIFARNWISLFPVSQAKSSGQVSFTLHPSPFTQEVIRLLFTFKKTSLWNYLLWRALSIHIAWRTKTFCKWPYGWFAVSRHQKWNSYPFNILSQETGIWTMIVTEITSPRFRSVRFFIRALLGKLFHQNLLELCMETPCWCPSKVTETSVIEFCHEIDMLLLYSSGTSKLILLLEQELFSLPKREQNASFALLESLIGLPF